MQQCASSQVSGINILLEDYTDSSAEKISLMYRCCLPSVAEKHSRNFMFEHMDELVMPYLLTETNRARLDSLQGRAAYFFPPYNPVKGHDGGTEFLF